MTNSIRKSKPSKPYDDFPLFPHATRRWAKKIKGRLHYFGPWDDPTGSLKKYLEQRDDLHAGLTPRKKGDEVQLRDVLNSFLTAKRHLRDTSEITARTWADYHATCERLTAAFRADRRVDDLIADDFTAYRARIARVWGPVALGNEIQRVRTVFKHAFESGIIAQPVRFGPDFKKPSKKTLRKVRVARGSKMFEPAQLRKMIKTAKQPLKAMILLGVNAGLGNSDIAAMEFKNVDLKAGWLDYPRPKTGVARRCPLWPDTVAAIRDWSKVRPDAKDLTKSERVFITKYGNPFDKANSTIKTTPLADNKVKESVVHCNPIALETKKLLQELGIHRTGIGFYALRHITETIGGECRDQVAVDHIMGHARDDMASTYRERISDERLRAVTDTIRAWLKSTKAAR